MPNVEKIKNVMGKPDAINLLRNRLLNLRVFYEYQEFAFIALYYALKKNKTAVMDSYKMILPPEYVRGSEFRTLVERFSSINETQLLNLAPTFAQSAVENQRFDMWFIYNLFLPFL